MHWLEARFRKQFERRGEHYLYREYDRDVLMDAADVEDLVAEWRAARSSPLVWGGLILGVGACAAAVLFEFRWDILVVFGALFLLWPASWRLDAGQRAARELAHSLEPVGPGHGRPNYWPNPVWVFMLTYFLFIDSYRDAFSMVLVGVLVTLLLADPLYQYWKSRRHPARRALAC